MAYISSSNIEVFPSAMRTAGNATGKFTSENNLTSILRHVTDKESYIISWDTTGAEVVIHGYYFKITGEIASNKFLCILTDNLNRLCSWESDRAVLDDSTNFKALRVEDSAPTAPTDYTTYSLKMIEANKLKLSWESIETTTEMSLKTKLDGVDTTLNEKANTNDVYIKTVADDKFQEKLITTGSNITIDADNKISVSGTVSNAENANVATKIGNNTVGSSSQFIYINAGTPTVGKQIFIANTAPTNAQAGDIWFVTE